MTALLFAEQRQIQGCNTKLVCCIYRCSVIDQRCTNWQTRVKRRQMQRRFAQMISHIYSRFADQPGKRILEQKPVKTYCIQNALNLTLQVEGHF